MLMKVAIIACKPFDDQYPIFVLAFCVFHKRHYSEQVVSALEEFKFNHFGHDQIILHENEIRKEEGAFNIFRSREQKFQFIDELTEIIEYSNFILISCVIDKRALRKQSDLESNPYHIALELEFRRICDGNSRMMSALPFEVLFSDKKVMSSGLQLADLVARPIGLNVLRPEQENRAFDVLKQKFFCEGGREQVGKGYSYR